MAIHMEDMVDTVAMAAMEEVLGIQLAAMGEVLGIQLVVSGMVATVASDASASLHMDSIKIYVAT